jgi:hypothetical protein
MLSTCALVRCDPVQEHGVEAARCRLTGKAVSMPDPDAAHALREQLDRWIAAGLIEADQAGRIEAAELARNVTAPRRRLPLVAEVLGYAGAVIAITAAGVAVHQFFRHVPPAAELAFTAVVAIGLLVAGAAMRTGTEPAFARLRSVLWLLATAGAAGFTAVLSGSFLHLSDSNVALLSEGAWLACAIPLWWRTRSVLQHLAVFGGAVALVETSVDRVHPNVGTFGIGLAAWVLAAMWGLAVYRGYLVPRTAGLLVSGVGALAGAIIAMDGAAAGQVLAVLTVAGLLSAGILLRRVLLIAIGGVGILYVVPDTATRYLPGSVAAPLAVAVVGLVLLGIALWLARTRRKA